VTNDNHGYLAVMEIGGVLLLVVIVLLVVLIVRR
jgi:hypothetical protein